MCEKVVMAEKRKLEFDSLSGVSEAESADIHSVYMLFLVTAHTLSRV